MENPTKQSIEGNASEISSQNRGSGVGIVVHKEPSSKVEVQTESMKQESPDKNHLTTDEQIKRPSDRMLCMK